MSSQKIDVSIVVPTHNRSDALDLTLEHLALQDFEGSWEVVVVNNNSTDDTAEVVAGWQRKFPVGLTLVSETTPGPAAARNTGARNAGGEYLIFIDNDILTEPDFVSRHFARLKENPGCWVVGQFPNLPEQENTVFGRYKRHLFPVATGGVLVEADGITAAGVSMPRSDFLSLGGFDETFFVASGEDRELGIRAVESGIKLIYDPSIVALHNDWAGTGIRDYCRRQRVYTQTEPLFALKYGERNPRREMTVRNSPIDPKADGYKLLLSKMGKSVAGSSVGQAGLIATCEVLERFIPDSPVLWRVYRAAIAGAIYKGYQEGLTMLSKTQRTSKKIGNESTAG